MKLIVFAACLVLALHGTNAQRGMQSQGRRAGMMADQEEASMSGRGMMASSGMRSESEMKSEQMSASQGGFSRGAKMNSGMMRSAGMMRASDMDSKKMDSGMMSSMGMMRSGMNPMGMERSMMDDSMSMRKESGMMSSGMRPMGMERSMMDDSMSMRKESGMMSSGMMSSKKVMSPADMMMKSAKPKGMMTEPRMDMMRPKKISAMNSQWDSMDMEQVRMAKKEEMRAHGILDEEMDVQPDGYMYKYKTEDGVDAFEHGKLTESRSAEGPSMEVEGMYTWFAPNGHLYKVEYKADESGFHPRVMSSSKP